MAYRTTATAMPQSLEDEEIDVVIPAVLLNHHMWKSSPALQSLQAVCVRNIIPPYTYRSYFEHLDNLATRLELTEPTSHATKMANWLCDFVTRAHYEKTHVMLRRKKNSLLAETKPNPHSTTVGDASAMADLRSELGRVHRDLQQHLMGIQTSALQIENTQTSLKRRIDTLEKGTGGSALDAVVRKADSRIGLLEQRKQIVSAGLSDALKRVGDLEGRLDFQDALLSGVKDASKKVDEMERRHNLRELQVTECLKNVQQFGDRLTRLEDSMGDIKAMLEASGQATVAPAVETSNGGATSGSLPTPPKETAAEGQSEDVEEPSAKRQRIETTSA